MNGVMDDAYCSGSDNVGSVVGLVFIPNPLASVCVIEAKPVMARLGTRRGAHRKTFAVAAAAGIRNVLISSAADVSVKAMTLAVCGSFEAALSAPLPFCPRFAQYMRCQKVLGFSKFLP